MTTKPSFEEFLRINTLVQERYVSYYVYWVKGFRYACKNDVRQLTYENMARFLSGPEGKHDGFVNLWLEVKVNGCRRNANGPSE